MSGTLGGRRPTGCAGKKGGLAATITAEIASEVERLISEGGLDGLDFEAVETAARRVALRVAGKAVAQRLNADRSDQAEPSRCCACGGQARYAGRRAKTFTTALGKMTLERAYYHCSGCGNGVLPHDRALGMDGTGAPGRPSEREGRAGKQPDGARWAEVRGFTQAPPHVP